MIVVGLTGSIGMGKSTTARFFEAMGCPVFDVDAAVRDAQKPGGEAIAAIKKAFPNAVGGNTLNRKKLGERVFNDKKALQKLEAIMHPIVERRRNDFFNEAAGADTRLVILDIPLLYETGISERCDKVVVVTATEEDQKNRVMARKGMTEEKFNDILRQQMADADKRKRADFVIDTSAGRQQAMDQVNKIIAEINNTQPTAFDKYWKKNA